MGEQRTFRVLDGFRVCLVVRWSLTCLNLTVAIHFVKCPERGYYYRSVTQNRADWICGSADFSLIYPFQSGSMEMITPGSHSVFSLPTVIGNIYNFKLVSCYHCLLLSQAYGMLLSKPNHARVCQKEMKSLDPR